MNKIDENAQCLEICRQAISRIIGFFLKYPKLHNPSPNHAQISVSNIQQAGFLFLHLQDNSKLVLNFIQSCSIILNLILYYKYSYFITPLQSKFNQSFMATNPPLKKYYEILGVSQSASLFEIENAYEKLAAKWHPDKHKQHRKTAEAKFHDISEAFEVLSDRNKRAHYDELLIKQYSLEDAHSTFDRFFNEHGIIDEEEEKFFNENYPSPLSNYYKVLGVPKAATLDDIKKAYRKLAIQYHPKTNLGNQQAHKKFIEVNEAYNALSDEFKKANYDNIIFGEIAPVRAHNIFEDFFGNRWFNLDDDDFKPIFHNKWIKNLDKMMIDEDEENAKEGETIKTSSYWTNKNGQETGKTVTTKKTVKDGKANQQTTEEYTFPNGEKNIVKTTKVDGKIETKKYSLKKGEEVPKELTE